MTVSTQPRFEVRPLLNEADLRWAERQLDTVIDAEDGTPEEAYREVLATLIEAYEAVHYPIPPVDPVDAILFRMDQQGLKPKDLVPLLGSRARVSEVLSRKRGLSLEMIRRLHSELGIPLESLVGTSGLEAVQE